MPKLTKEQKKKLHEFEPALQRAAKRGDYQSAKKVAFDIQKLLRPTGHETRLMKSKNLLFEAAMESGELDTAMSGFIGVRNKTSKQTRVHLEATALLAVCYLRKNELKKAEPLISFVIDHKKNIISISKRRKFITKIIKRFEEEGAFASLKNSGCDQLSPQELEGEAGKLLMSMSEDEIFIVIGKTTPARTKKYILNIDDFARKQLTSGELKFLPDTQERKNNHKVGKTVFSSFKRVLWKSFCDPESEIYKAWYAGGLKLILNKYFIGVAVAAILASHGAAIKPIAVAVTALIIKFGIEVFCDRYQPEGIVI